MINKEYRNHFAPPELLGSEGAKWFVRVAVAMTTPIDYA